MIWVISDIHGAFKTLEKLIQRVKSSDSDASFVFVGDYVDRGIHNKEVVDLVIKLQAEEGAIALRGNHDNVVDWLLNDEKYQDGRRVGHCMGNMSEFVRGVPDFHNMISWWRRNGLDETLVSYGASDALYNPKASPVDIAREFQDKVPQAHKDFFRNLPLAWESETHFACHGYFRPRMEPRNIQSLPNYIIDEILWSRFSDYDLRTPVLWEQIGIFGHTPVQSMGASAPIKAGKIRLIDTGVHLNEYICAYCTDRDDWILQATDSRDFNVLGEK